MAPQTINNNIVIVIHFRIVSLTIQILHLSNSCQENDFVRLGSFSLSLKNKSISLTMSKETIPLDLPIKKTQSLPGKE